MEPSSAPAFAAVDARNASQLSHDALLALWFISSFERSPRLDDDGDAVVVAVNEPVKRHGAMVRS